MHCKKGGFFVLVFAVFLLLQLTLVAAATQTERFTEFLDGVGGFVEPVSTRILGDYSGTDELALQVLAFLLVALVVYGVLSMVNFFGPGKEWINVLIGVIVAIIGVRFMPSGFLEAATLPSSALVMFLVLVVPFIVTFYVIHHSVNNQMVRRALWAVYGVTLLVLWVYNYLNNTSPVAGFLYPAIFLGILAAFAFDGTFQKWWNKSRADQMIAEGARDAIDRLVGEIDHLENLLSGAVSSTQALAYQRQIKKLQANLDKLQKVSSHSFREWGIVSWIAIALILLMIVYLFWSDIKDFLGF